MADLIFIWSIQYYGNYEAGERFEYLEHIYGNVITELDPKYVDPYLIGSLIMSIEAQDHEMALRLLDKGIAANPDEWILPFEAGFTCYHQLQDYERAARYFELAARRPDAPSAIRRMHAEMFNKLGDKRSSLMHWREIHQAADTDYIRDISWRHVHDLTIEVDIEALEATVRRYRERTGVNPRGFNQLVSEGALPTLPMDPDGRPYVYDPRTGEVSSQSRWRLYRRPGD